VHVERQEAPVLRRTEAEEIAGVLLLVNDRVGAFRTDGVTPMVDWVTITPW